MTIGDDTKHPMSVSIDGLSVVNMGLKRWGDAGSRVPSTLVSGITPGVIAPVSMMGMSMVNAATKGKLVVGMGSVGVP